MVETKGDPQPRIGNVPPIHFAETRVLAAAGIVATITVVACWLPIFQVGGFVYTMVDLYRGKVQFLAAAALPVALGLAALALASRWPGPASVAVLAAAVMTSLAPVNQLTEAMWVREHPERLGAPFQFRAGFPVGVVGVAGGAVVFAALVRALLAERPAERDARIVTRGVACVAAAGLVVAVGGQLAESSSAHLWELPRWPQAGHWWKLAVTTSICAIAFVRRTLTILAPAVVVAIAAAASAVQQLIAVSAQQDDPAVSSTVTAVGFIIVAMALTAALVGSLRHR
jgi:hypothetical protein